MADNTQDGIKKATEDALVLFVCKTDLRSAIMSGLVGSLQRFGYPPEDHRLITYAFDHAVDAIQGDSDWDFDHSTGTNGMTIYLGLCHVNDLFGGAISHDTRVARDVGRQFRELQISSLVGPSTGGIVNGQQQVVSGPTSPAQHEITEPPVGSQFLSIFARVRPSCFNIGAASIISFSQCPDIATTVSAWQSSSPPFRLAKSVAFSTQSPTRTPAGRQSLYSVDETQLLYRAALPETTMTRYREQAISSVSDGPPALVLQNRTERDMTSQSGAQHIGNAESQGQEHNQNIAAELEADDIAEVTTDERKVSVRVNVWLVKIAHIDLSQDAMMDDEDDGEDPGDDLARLEERETSDSAWDEKVDVSEWLDFSSPTLAPLSIATKTADSLYEVIHANEFPAANEGQGEARYEMRRALEDLLAAWDGYTSFRVPRCCESDSRGPLLPTSDGPITKKTIVDGIQLVSTEAKRPMAALDSIRLTVGDVLIDTIESLEWSSGADADSGAKISAITNAFDSLRHIRNGMEVVLRDLEDQLERVATQALLSAVQQAPPTQKAQSTSPNTPKQGRPSSANVQWDPEEELFNWTLYWEENGGSAEANRKYEGYMVSCTTRADVFNEWRNASGFTGQRTWASMEQHQKKLRTSKEHKITYVKLKEKVNHADHLIGQAMLAVRDGFSRTKAEAGAGVVQSRKRKRSVKKQSSN
ncbi:hypothetical protein LTR53_002088 [Teratosphaeriaceae sp. CCFEE 6253]|nr:hypothetical protein LTR53_002088 [Teratosphaeriaceae sp. CCFEE 6253]